MMPPWRGRILDRAMGATDGVDDRNYWDGLGKDSENWIQVKGALLCTDRGAKSLKGKRTSPTDRKGRKPRDFGTDNGSRPPSEEEEEDAGKMATDVDDDAPPLDEEDDDHKKELLDALLLNAIVERGDAGKNRKEMQAPKAEDRGEGEVQQAGKNEKRAAVPDDVWSAIPVKKRRTMDPRNARLADEAKAEELRMQKSSRDLENRSWKDASKSDNGDGPEKVKGLAKEGGSGIALAKYEGARKGVPKEEGVRNGAAKEEDPRKVVAREEAARRGMAEGVITGTGDRAKGASEERQDVEGLAGDSMGEECSKQEQGPDSRDGSLLDIEENGDADDEGEEASDRSESPTPLPARGGPPRGKRGRRGGPLRAGLPAPLRDSREHPSAREGKGSPPKHMAGHGKAGHPRPSEKRPVSGSGHGSLAGKKGGKVDKEQGGAGPLPRGSRVPGKAGRGVPGRNLGELEEEGDLTPKAGGELKGKPKRCKIEVPDGSVEPSPDHLSLTWVAGALAWKGWANRSPSARSPKSDQMVCTENVEARLPDEAEGEEGRKLQQQLGRTIEVLQGQREKGQRLCKDLQELYKKAEERAAEKDKRLQEALAVREQFRKGAEERKQLQAEAKEVHRAKQEAVRQVYDMLGRMGSGICARVKLEEGFSWDAVVAPCLEQKIQHLKEEYEARMQGGVLLTPVAPSSSLLSPATPVSVDTDPEADVVAALVKLEGGTRFAPPSPIHSSRRPVGSCPAPISRLGNDAPQLHMEGIVANHGEARVEEDGWGKRGSRFSIDGDVLMADEGKCASGTTTVARNLSPERAGRLSSEVGGYLFLAGEDAGLLSGTHEPGDLSKTCSSLGAEPEVVGKTVEAADVSGLEPTGGGGMATADEGADHTAGWPAGEVGGKRASGALVCGQKQGIEASDEAGDAAGDRTGNCVFAGGTGNTAMAPAGRTGYTSVAPGHGPVALPSKNRPFKVLGAAVVQPPRGGEAFPQQKCDWRAGLQRSSSCTGAAPVGAHGAHGEGAAAYDDGGGGVAEVYCALARPPALTSPAPAIPNEESRMSRTINGEGSWLSGGGKTLATLLPEKGRVSAAGFRPVIAAGGTGAGPRGIQDAFGLGPALGPSLSAELSEDEVGGQHHMGAASPGRSHSATGEHGGETVLGAVKVGGYLVAVIKGKNEEMHSVESPMALAAPLDMDFAGMMADGAPGGKAGLGERNVGKAMEEPFAMPLAGSRAVEAGRREDPGRESQLEGEACIVEEAASGELRKQSVGKASMQHARVVPATSDGMLETRDGPKSCVTGSVGSVAKEVVSECMKERMVGEHTGHLMDDNIESAEMKSNAENGDVSHSPEDVEVKGYHGSVGMKNGASRFEAMETGDKWALAVAGVAREKGEEVVVAGEEDEYCADREELEEAIAAVRSDYEVVKKQWEAYQLRAEHLAMAEQRHAEEERSLIVPEIFLKEELVEEDDDDFIDTLVVARGYQARESEESEGFEEMEYRAVKAEMIPCNTLAVIPELGPYIPTLPHQGPRRGVWPTKASRKQVMVAHGGKAGGVAAQDVVVSTTMIDGNTGLPRPRKFRKPWAQNEVMKLLDGLEKFGVGRWAHIKRVVFPTDAHRTVVDLKDKWRNLLTAARNSVVRPHMKGKKPVYSPHVPLPASILKRVNDLASTVPPSRGVKEVLSRKARCHGPVEGAGGSKAKVRGQRHG